MKKVIILFSVLLLVWIAGSSYIYVCKVKKDCCTTKNTDNNATANGEASKDSLQTPVIASEISVPDGYTFFFDVNKSTCDITIENTSHFKQIKEYLSAYADKKVTVTGHSDASGSKITKDKISALRAEFIKNKLVESGIPVGAIETIAESDHIQAADNSTAEGRAKNRRTEILIK